MLEGSHKIRETRREERTRGGAGCNVKRPILEIFSLLKIEIAIYICLEYLFSPFRSYRPRIIKN